MESKEKVRILTKTRTSRIPLIDLSEFKRELKAPKYKSMRSIKRKGSLMRDSKTPKNDHLRPFNTERKFSDRNKTNHQDSKNQNSNSELSHLMKKELL